MANAVDFAGAIKTFLLPKYGPGGSAPKKLQALDVAGALTTPSAPAVPFGLIYPIGQSWETQGDLIVRHLEVRLAVAWQKWSRAGVGDVAAHAEAWDLADQIAEDLLRQSFLTGPSGTAYRIDEVRGTRERLFEWSEQYGVVVAIDITGQAFSNVLA